MFVALDLPASTRDALATWRDELVAGRDDLRPVPPDALHVTLVFLGWRNEADAERIAALTLDAAKGLQAPRLTAGDVRGIPPRGIRLFALDLADDDGRCGTLQGSVSDALERERFYKREKRPFWPHLTLARVKKGARAAPLPDAPPTLEPFDATQLTLYRSTLRPQGAVYDPLARGHVG